MSDTANRLGKPYEEHLQERLRTNKERADYLQAALDAVENYSPKNELAALCLVVQDVIKSLQPSAAKTTSDEAFEAWWRSVDNPAHCSHRASLKIWQAAAAWKEQQDLACVETVRNNPKWVIREQNSMMERLCLQITDKRGRLMSEAQFDIYKGMTGRDFEFKGADRGKGAMFEHKPCGFTVRLAPGMTIGNIADMIAEHDCEKDAAFDDAISAASQRL